MNALKKKKIFPFVSFTTKNFYRHEKRKFSTVKYGQRQAHLHCKIKRNGMCKWKRIFLIVLNL